MVRNLKFKNAEAKIRSIYRIPRVLITWELEKTSQNLSGLTFVIKRGESPTGLVPISGLIPSYNKYEFMDYTAQLKMIDKVYYYQIVAQEIECGVIKSEFESEIFELDEQPDLVSMYVIEEHLFAFQHVYGAPGLIYLKKSEGTRCDCWDHVLKRVSKSNCVTCRGTGFIEGYYEPIVGWFNFDPDQNGMQVADFGKKEISQCDAVFTDYPEIGIGDIIVKLKPQKFYRVENSRATKKNEATLLQFIRLTEINKSDIEQSIEIPHEIADNLIKEWQIRNKQREF